ncbi:hypothetical protein ONZ51_g10128 [Trametes cubensis]|uniref:Uncharacterized protein n=1 Tax=Trametes cubensis TaxID=1111947 RepID=A0AAD7TK40_9APHY|nr:hypothetical protein ONZ51_g10128 [Trametes cubensis]
MPSGSGPVTRSRRNVEAGPSGQTKLDEIVDEDDVDGTKAQATTQTGTSSSKTDSNGASLQSLLQRALGGAKELERENATLRKKVDALQSKLDRLVETEDVVQLRPQRGRRRTGETIAELSSEVKLLRKQVQRLEKSNEKQRKRIHKLSIRELKNEAEDLVDTAEFEVGDSAHKMRKARLLRRFHDLMLENSVEENEECLICMENLQPRKCRSTTASEPAPGNPLESSPEPAAQAEQDDAPETPGRLRKRRAIITPSPEPENNETGELAEAGPSGTVVADQANAEDPSGSTQPASPTTPTQPTPSYAQSPSKDKRKMLEQLAEARSKKRRL